MADKRKVGAEPPACECKPSPSTFLSFHLLWGGNIEVVGAVSWARCDAGVIYVVVSLSHAASPPR